MLEIPPHGVVGMQAVDMQQVNSAIGKIITRYVESTADQSGERAEMRRVKADDISVNLLAIMPRLLVAPPCVNGKGASVGTEDVDGLTEGKIGIAGMCT